jgi:hypothetical protein
MSNVQELMTKEFPRTKSQGKKSTFLAPSVASRPVSVVKQKQLSFWSDGDLTTKPSSFARATDRLNS